jgi:hypothetical protein
MKDQQQKTTLKGGFLLLKLGYLQICRVTKPTTLSNMTGLSIIFFIQYVA